MLTLKKKPTFEEFIKTCTPLLKLPSLEQEFTARVDEIAQRLALHQQNSDPTEALVSFIRADDDFLGVLLALTNLSQEKFLRVLSAQRFAQDDFKPEWGIKRVIAKIRLDNDFAASVASLFLESRRHSLLKQVADFYLDQLDLPTNWQSLLLDDPTIVKSAIRRKLAGEYADRKGKAIESLVRAEPENIYGSYGVSFAHGQVALVQKEVDFALPSLDDPHVLIMVSYMETTSSSQTIRANEQNTMYQTIVGDNVRYGHDRVLVNVVDGGGWLARRSDLRKLYSGCTYILSTVDLGQLEPIVCAHVPVAAFRNKARPTVTIER